MGDVLRYFGRLALTVALLGLIACSCSSSSPPANDNPQQAGQPDQQQLQPGDDQPDQQPDQPAADEQDQAEPEPAVEPEPQEEEPVPEEKPEPQEEQPQPSGGAVELSEVDYGFSGAFSEPAVRLPSAFSDPLLELPIDLGGVGYADRYELNDGQLAQLSQSGFVVTPDDYREFDALYENTEMYDQPVFVTVDSVLHVYHLAFDKLLRDLEDGRFYGTIAELTAALVDETGRQYARCEGTALAEPARHAWAYCVVARQLIGENPPPVPADVEDLVAPELELIEAHAGFGSSPVLGVNPNEPYTEDYSQYVPRGHYTRSEQRQRFFRAMMWFGRMNMRLKVADETRMALLLTRALHAAEVSSGPATAAWSAVYDPTAFLVGNSDDLSVREYSQLASEVYGDDLTLAEIMDDELLEHFSAAAAKLPPPKINSLFVLTSEGIEKETKGFRLMGQRFVLDGYIFQQLIHDLVANRMLPNGLDVLAAMGNDEAYTVLAELGETGYNKYDSQMAELRGEIGELGAADWSQNVYFCWLYCLDGVAQLKDSAFPPFMRTTAWARKDLQTALGSWAELKHDTILYAKQPMTAGAAPPGETVWNWAEPHPLAYARLCALAELTQGGLSERGLLSYEVEQLLSSLKSRLEILQRVAEQELAGETISTQDNDTLKYHGGWLGFMIDKSSDKLVDPISGWENDIADEPAAIIADVATDAMSGRVLEVGTGNIFNLFVVIPDGYGGRHLARGGVYSYYEFPWPMGDRLTDEAWRAKVKSGSVPDQPSWTAAFIVE